MDWLEERPAYKLPMIVDTPRGKEDISEWAARKVTIKWWITLRGGGHEWNARIAVKSEVLPTLEHGKTYALKDICNRDGLMLASVCMKIKKMPEKVQFIAEELAGF